ncbi:phage integrase N-terminal SAM-like domain-containing protein [Xanthomonas melonis]|uniref:phage integrase N-terminal SAM-like domain-containing protein n=1 Tax=Xanthomonas melonis TaxID=56456 RepID=UPI002E788492|nr:phage integrase N-terminal SAM-like domain-containing protein [Xanthomonas melonis]
MHPREQWCNSSSSTRLLDQVRDRLRVRHYSLRTEQAHLSWTRRFILASRPLPQRTAYRSASRVRRKPWCSIP